MEARRLLYPKDNKAITAVVVTLLLAGVVLLSWFWKSKGGEWDLTNVERPWQDGVSIHSHIREHISPDANGLQAGGNRLPDEVDDGGVKWAAGAMDGAFGHHGGGGNEQTRAKLLHRALKVVVEDASSEKMKKLYEQLLQEGVLDFIDPLLELIAERQDLDAERLEELAVWIAKNAPDREPVKFAIAVLGIAQGSDNSTLLLTLGRHEEFTLYSAVALSNTAGAGAEKMLFELAQHVDGWGRISIVERLADTTDPQIKSWMLREGYRNSIMYEYLAYTCAVAGGLRAELEKNTVDPEVLNGAADIIQALVTGGPAENMDDYADGAVVSQRFLHHLGKEPRGIGELIGVDYIQRFLDEEEADWTARESRGWTQELRNELGKRAAEIKTLPYWNEVVSAGLASDDRAVFGEADIAARAIGLDTWDHHFGRLKSGKDDGWYYVMQTDDETRIDRVIALAVQTLPLDAIASGPAEEMGLGLEWSSHSHLDFVLQDLRRFPGKGWELIRTGVSSPVIRNRHMALRALSPWGRTNWPDGAERLLRDALPEEPDGDVRAEIETLLAGREIEEPQWNLSDE